MSGGEVDGAKIRAERIGAVTVLWLNRPEVCNAMDGEMYGELLAALRVAEADPYVRCVVITGTGRYFSSGRDLKERAAAAMEPAAYFEDAMWGNSGPGVLYGYLARYRKPLVTAVNGPALGGGLVVALLGDISVVAVDATLSFPELERGVTPDGATLVLPRLIGRAKAMLLVLTGRVVGAAEAEALGLISMTAPPDLVLETALAVAQEIVTKSAVAVQLFKASLQAGPWGADRTEDFVREAARALVDGTEGSRRGVEDFRRGHGRTPMAGAS